MKNFNFAFFFSLYVIINGSVYMKSPDRNYLFISIIVTLPLLFLSVNSLVAKPDNTQNPPIDEFDLLQESLIPYLAALIGATIFVVNIYRLVGDSTRPAVFFMAPRIQGWNWQDGAVIGLIALLLGASGIGIWSAQFRQKHMAAGRLEKTAAYYIFHIGLPPGFRLFVYFAAMILLSAVGFLVVYYLFGKTTIRNNDWRGYLIVAGRAVLPVVIFLMSGLLRIPLLPVALIVIAAIGYLFGLSTSYAEGGVFVGSQILIAGIYAIIVARKSRKTNTPVVQSAIKQPGNGDTNDSSKLPDNDSNN